ncbi:MAG: ATPase, T2SS/T4P/T4SS family, partial [Burkholderiales bacterium]
VGMDTRSYNQALISAMREAPDLLMIGEIRDQPTLQSALLFAQTGHLCLSTLHANNSYHALNRIINFFPREAREALLADLAISLRCIMSQRLIRAKGGGRIPAVEVLLNTAHISELIKNGAMGEIKDAMEQSLAPGSQTFEQALFNLYSTGQITLENALASSDSPTNLHWLINNTGRTATEPAPSQEDMKSSTRTTTGHGDDLSSIKLNLDMV